MSDIYKKYTDFKSGYVTIIGKPNVGKSTLMNKLLGEKLSIVTSKAQTTRLNILGILNEPGMQIIFQDTPGIIEPSYRLQEIMMNNFREAVNDADILLFMTDAADPEFNPENFKSIQKISRPVILIINKIDQSNQKNILSLIEKLQALYPFDSIIPVSALSGKGIDKIISEIKARLPVNPPYYPEDYLTDLPEKFFVAEIVREKLFENLSEEIPYSTHVEIEQFKERETGKYFIQAAIYVERLSQKKIVVGKNGSMVKRIGRLARKDIESFLDQAVYLELFVKVFEDWRRKNRKLKTLGYE